MAAKKKSRLIRPAVEAELNDRITNLFGFSVQEQKIVNRIPRAGKDERASCDCYRTRTGAPRFRRKRG
jgi:hypothetical protein